MDCRWTLTDFKKEYIWFIQNVGNSRELLTAFFDHNMYFLPKYPSDRVITYADLTKGFQRLESRYVKSVPISSLYGNTWLFTGDLPDERPIPLRMAFYMHEHNRDNYHPIACCVDLQDGRYLVEDGNHRIYSAYLQGWETIDIEIESTHG